MPSDCIVVGIGIVSDKFRVSILMDSGMLG